MAEVRSSGPQMGQFVIYTQTQSTFYPAIIVSVDRSSGLVRLTTFPAAGTTGDAQNVSSDETGNTAGRRSDRVQVRLRRCTVIDRAERESLRTVLDSWKGAR